MAADGIHLSTGMVISIVYGAGHLILLLFLTIYVYIDSRKKGQKLSFKQFILALWKERGVYAPVIIHIYDTATDVGVLVEWYKLSKIEENGTNLESLDMIQFFWIAVVFMIVYRFLLGCGGALLFIDRFEDDMPFNNSKCQILTAGLIGFILGSLELLLFVGIFIDFKKKKGKKNPVRGAGETQKSCQSSEGVLESLPEVIMQSVFYMRAINDETLNKAAGDIVYLVAFSIAASLLSITSKYVWVDEYMVRESAKSLIMKNDDEKNDGVLMGNVCCMKGYDISYGYIIRVTWRLAAVTARFVIIALIWVVLGGYIEFILIPIMVFAWYILLFFYATRGNFKGTMKALAEIMKDFKSEQWNDADCSYRCLWIFIFIVGFIGVLIGGVVLQLGIAVVSGAGIYIIRMIENFVLMTVITIFAIFSFDCHKCADPEQRLAFGADGNKRILLWIIVGWSSVIIHAIMSCLIPKVMDKDYEFDLQAASEQFWYEQAMQAIDTRQEFESEKDKLKMKIKKQTKGYDMDKIRICECGEKFVAMRAGWCFYGVSKVCCTYQEGCGSQYKYDEIVWHCEYVEAKKEKHIGYTKGYTLCNECVVKEPNDDKIKSMQKLRKTGIITKELSIPTCICGMNMLPIMVVGIDRCKDCGCQCRWIIWRCPEGKNSEHNEGYGYFLCVKCGTKDEYLARDQDTKYSKKWTQLLTMIKISNQTSEVTEAKNYEYSPNCSCGGKLMPIQVINEDQKGSCNKCSKNIDWYDMIWYCTKGEVESHTSGYRLCVECGCDNNVDENDGYNDENITIEEQEAGRTVTGIELTAYGIDETNKED